MIAFLQTIYQAVGLSPQSWFLAFLCLSMLDGALTYYALKGSGTEANPLIRWTISKMGPMLGILAPKVLSIVGVFLLYKGGYLWLIPLVFLYALVVLWNTYALYQSR